MSKPTEKMANLLPASVEVTFIPLAWPLGIGVELRGSAQVTAKADIIDSIKASGNFLNGNAGRSNKDDRVWQW